MLDTLMAAGEVVWAGVEPLGDRDGRIALYLTDHAARLRPPAADRQASGGAEPTGRAADILRICGDTARRFSRSSIKAPAADFPRRRWTRCGISSGAGSSPTTRCIRSALSSEREDDARPAGRACLATTWLCRDGAQPFRSRRLVPPHRRRTLVALETRTASRAAATEWSAALAQQLLTRHGIVTRETVAAEGVPGGFSAVYDVLKAMEEAGRIRRGYFVGGLGARAVRVAGGP